MSDVHEGPRSLTVTNGAGNPVELTGFDLHALLSRLTDSQLAAPVVAGRMTPNGAQGSSVMKIAYDFEKGGAVIYLELDRPKIQPQDHTNRGFPIWTEFDFEEYEGQECERSFSVQTSSLATEDKVWIGLGSDRAHLNVHEAKRVRDALTGFIESVER